MVIKKYDRGQLTRLPVDVDEERENEKRLPAWVRKYLDLADLLMKRRKNKPSEQRKKAA